MTEDKICPICGENFNPHRKSQQYCSPRCAAYGRKQPPEAEATERVNKFIDDLLSMNICDVLEGKLEANSTNNRMTVKGARAWKDKKYIVLVVDQN